MSSGPLLLRQAAGGPFFEGNPGDVLVCIDGKRWQPAAPTVVAPAFNFKWVGQTLAELYTAPPAAGFLLTRDGFNPLLCVLENLTAGNVVEAAFSYGVGEGNANAGGLLYGAVSVIVVSFEAAPVFPADFTGIAAGAIGQWKVRSTDTGGGTEGGGGTVSSLGAVVVPPGKTKITIGLSTIFTGEAGITDLQVIGAIIRACEVPAAYVPVLP